MKYNETSLNDISEAIPRAQLAPGYSIARVLNGLWQLSPGHSLTGALDMEDIQYAFNKLVDYGFTTFDLADIYIGAEDALGTFLRSLRSHSSLTPQDIQIHEKYVPDYDILSTVKFEDTQRIIDRSLKKLGRDYIDVIQYHWWDYNIDRYVDVAQNLVKLQEQGKIRYIGVTNFDTEHMKALVDGGIPVISCQSQYSVFDHRVEKTMIEYGKAAGIQQICYGTLAGGLLSERYMGSDRKNANNNEQMSASLAQPETRSQVKYQQIIEASVGQDGYQELLVLLNDIAKSHDVHIAQIATRYILDKEGVAATIIGIRNSKHVHDNAKIFSFDLSDYDRERIDNFLHQYPTVPGEPYELERDPHSIFRSIIRMNEAEGSSHASQ
ncbi:aldo/keto reductase [Alloscardovia theropitheci]|uniref:Aldo/keto reductase n=1 Tax=Alloscardovia theropitheci TaxID=2496842 RepID=A0A4R0QRR1_9BIFI|nr:aldo/keto reductase [Alloscardovia theropitheci]TCD55043.1 aldo/keto reductase [Alloscardovia theropitheci]